MINDPKGFYWKTEEILSLISGVFLTLFILVVISDMFGFMDDPETYIRVYHLDTTQKNWEFGYLGNSAMRVALAISGLVIYFLSWKKRNNYILKFTRIAITVLLFSRLIIGFYQWYLTGFDH